MARRVPECDRVRGYRDGSITSLHGSGPDYFFEGAICCFARSVVALASVTSRQAV